VKLELLYFDDCPNWKLAAERLDAVAATRGLTKAAVSCATARFFLI
jgi:hypothetical protein